MRRRLAGALAAVVLLLVAFVDVSIIEPRIHVRWRDDVAEAQRLELERRYRLVRGEPLPGTTWRYELDDRSSENVRSLIECIVASRVDGRRGDAANVRHRR